MIFPLDDSILWIPICTIHTYIQIYKLRKSFSWAKCLFTYCRWHNKRSHNTVIIIVIKSCKKCKEPRKNLSCQWYTRRTIYNSQCNYFFILSFFLCLRSTSGALWDGYIRTRTFIIFFLFVCECTLQLPHQAKLLKHFFNFLLQNTLYDIS